LSLGAQITATLTITDAAPPGTPAVHFQSSDPAMVREGVAPIQ